MWGCPREKATPESRSSGRGQGPRSASGSSLLRTGSTEGSRQHFEWRDSRRTFFFVLFKFPVWEIDSILIICGFPMWKFTYVLTLPGAPEGRAGGGAPWSLRRCAEGWERSRRAHARLRPAAAPQQRSAGCRSRRVPLGRQAVSLFTVTCPGGAVQGSHTRGACDLPCAGSARLDKLHSGMSYTVSLNLMNQHILNKMF